MRASAPALVDGDLGTAAAAPDLLGAEWTIRLPRPTAIVLIAVHHSAAARGRVAPAAIRLTFADGTSLPLACEPKDGWYRARVPQVRTDRIVLRVDSTADNRAGPGGLDEVDLREVAPLPDPPSAETAEVFEVTVTPESTPCNPLGHGYMLNYFERGLVDGLTEPQTRREFLRVCRDFGVTALRFPGGSFAYTYPTRREGLQAFKEAGLAELSYNLWEPQKWGWCREEDFFGSCRDAGITAWYQVNPGYWYDAERNVVHQIRDFDAGEKVRRAQGDYLPQACADAAKRARRCREQGVNVVWEIGNEDYCYFGPESYAAIAAAFMRAIESAAPGSRFALCTDSTSWSDWSWRDALLAALPKVGVTAFDFASTHIYATGAGEWVDEKTWRAFPRATGRELFDTAQRSWAQLRSWHLPGMRRALDEHGFRRTQIAITEFNVIGPNTVTEECEHSFGRALGEAMIYPDLAGSCAAIFFHDLVRNGPGFGNYFQRLDYYPDHRPGCRYHWQAEGAALRLIQPHHRGTICLNRSGVVVSRNSEGLYLSLCNGTGKTRRILLHFVGLRHPAGPVRLELLRAASLEAWGYDYANGSVTARRTGASDLTVDVPPCSLVAGLVK